MVQRSQQLRLPLEPRQPLRVLVELTRQGLDPNDAAALALSTEPFAVVQLVRAVATRDGSSLAVLSALDGLYQALERWGDRANVLETRIGITEDAEERRLFARTLVPLTDDLLASSPRRRPAFPLVRDYLRSLLELVDDSVVGGAARSLPSWGDMRLGRPAARRERARA